MKKIIPEDAKLIPDEAECVFSGVIYDIYQWQQELFDGSFATFEMLRRPDTIRAICIDDGKIVILNAQQSGTQSKTSFPEGRVDPKDASIVAAAQREVKEETGMEFANWKLVEVTQPDHKMEWFIYTLITTGKTKQSKQQLDAGEKISVSMKTFDEVKELVENSTRSLFWSRNLFDAAISLDELRVLPNCKGVQVDR